MTLCVSILTDNHISSPIPEITDADLAYQADQSDANNDTKPLKKQYLLFHAAFTQFCYCGSQVAIATYFINYAIETRAGTSASLAAQFLAGAQGAFAVGRFVGVILMSFIRPRKIFLAYFTLVIVFVACAIPLRGNIGISMLFLTLFFESIIFPTIVALGMRGLGKHSKQGSGFIIGGVVGGAVVPPIMGAVSDMRGSDTATAFSVPLAFFVVAWSYPICVNFVSNYRYAIDRMGDQEAYVSSSSGSNNPESSTHYTAKTANDHVEENSAKT